MLGDLIFPPMNPWQKWVASNCKNHRNFDIWKCGSIWSWVQLPWGTREIWCLWNVCSY
jgi:hypothetical protein